MRCEECGGVVWKGHECPEPPSPLSKDHYTPPFTAIGDRPTYEEVWLRAYMKAWDSSALQSPPSEHLASYADSCLAAFKERFS